jgi:hypothetical protein
MPRTSIVISSEEATALLTCLEYYILFDLEKRDKHRKGQLLDYEPVPDRTLQTLNEIRPRLLAIAKGST